MAIKALISRWNGLGKKEREKERDREKEREKDKALPDLPAALVPAQTRSTLPPRRPLSVPPAPHATTGAAGEMAKIVPLEPLDTLLPPALLSSIPESSPGGSSPSAGGASPRTPPAKSSPSATANQRGKMTASTAVSSSTAAANGTTASQGQGGGEKDPQGTQKRVAFISPPPTPGGLNTLQLPSEHPPGSSSSSSSPGQGGQGGTGKEEPRRRGNSFTGPEAVPSREKEREREKLKARTYSTPSSSSASRPTPSRQSQSANPSRLATSPPDALAFSLRSGTPYSHLSGRSFVQPPRSWSEAASLEGEGDLVGHLGARERTRQEVLWEIVGSEERYVQELLKMKETFIDPLLHPFSSSAHVPPSSPPMGGVPGGANFLPLPEESEDFYRPTSRTASASTHTHGPSTLATGGANSSAPESLEHLPIAARFLSPSSLAALPSPLGDIEGEQSGTLSSEEADLADVDNHQRRATATATRNAALSPGHGPTGRSPYGQRAASRTGGQGRAGPVPFPSRSHQSLPPPPRSAGGGANGAISAVSLAGVRNAEGMAVPSSPTTATSSSPSQPSQAQSRTTPTPNPTTSRLTRRKLHKRPTSPTSPPHNPSQPDAVPPQALPEDLRECLLTLERGILGGHIALSEMLRRRYEEQYPLVRSLADVFVLHSHILREYATYVLHLERALEQVDAFLSTDVKKKPKKQDAVEWMRISKILQRLEETAADKGETGLSICLSKPFQRLLKYPLLFQNLLYHTDPSTYEYESTLLMVAEVEEIVRSIEDEKILKESRDRTRDVLARIDGLEKVKLLAAPKPSRVLLDEKPLEPAGSTDTNLSAKDGQSQSLPSRSVKQKTSFRRLSENVLGVGGGGGPPAMGSKKDLWLVTFNDVSLRCQRTGVTTLPLVSSAAAGGPGLGGKSTSAPDLGGKSKYATTGKRAAHVKPRNLYKFVKIETWAMPADADPMSPKIGVVSMEDVSKTHAKLTQEALADAGLADDDAEDSDDSDRKSKMSFSYWGADKITVKRTPLSAANAGRTSARSNTPRRTPVGLNMQSSPATAKFGSRLRNPDHPPTAGGRPMSRTTGPVRRNTNSTQDDSKPQRPPWGSNMGSANRVPTSTARKSQNAPSTTASISPAAAARKDTNPSPVPETVRTTKYSTTPSEDSGVGLYRQIIAANPSINKLNMM